MSFLPPSNRNATTLPFTQSDFGLSNLIAIIGRINNARAQQSVSPTWLRDQVNEFSESLDSYIADGGEPSEMLWTIHFCKSLAIVTTGLLGSGIVREEDYIETMKEVVAHISAITETLGHSAFGGNLDCRWHGFIVNHVCHTTFGEF